MSAFLLFSIFDSNITIVDKKKNFMPSSLSLVAMTALIKMSVSLNDKKETKVFVRTTIYIPFKKLILF